MRQQIVFDEAKCSACGACAVACMDQNDIDVSAGQRPYRWVTQREQGEERVYLSLSCLHCPDPPCGAVCPAGCLTWEEETGLVVWDNAACIGCRRCEGACAYGAITFRPDRQGGRGRMEKCTGCRERLEDGRLPACVHACPTGALTLHPGSDPQVRAHQAQLYRRWLSREGDRR